MPISAAPSSTLVWATNLHTARVGGNLALADFHVTPPLGKSILDQLSQRPVALQSLEEVGGIAIAQYAGRWMRRSDVCSPARIEALALRCVDGAGRSERQLSSTIGRTAMKAAMVVVA